MSLLSQSIRNLIGGVSQQEEKLRSETQCEDQINCRNSLVDGMGKRPSTELISTLANLDTSDASVHFIERDTNERYIMVITDGSVRVFNTDTGVEYPVVDNAQANKEYLRHRSKENVQNQFQVLTTADTSIILNKQVPVEQAYVRETT
ncbi:phage nozzle protein [Microbulbifer sp. ZKSA002]|uniref:phage nozzle protein n=1 Tax=Microbulbifer sp. ZKSA002 TaxID=3243388 RepID=UPI0040394BDC